ncbi:MAG: nucleotidyltransferase family protein [Aminipila sp.]
MEAIILAGGLGTRLANVVSDVPKPMAPVAGKPFLQYILDDLIDKGITHVIIAVCYKKECIIDFFGSSYKNISINYSIEEKPLYTGGAIKKALSMCKEQEVFVINGDTYFDVNLKDMLLDASKDVEILIAVKRMFDFSRYGEVKINSQKIVEAFNEKKYCKEGFINGGIYLIKRSCLTKFPEAFSLENDYFPLILEQGKMKAFKSEGFFIDIGIPEDYKLAQACFKEK